MKFLDHVYLVGSGAMGFDLTSRSDCNVYLLDGGGETALVDAGTGESAEETAAGIEEAGFAPEQVGLLLLTHLHADHAGGAARLRELTGARVAACAAGKRILETADEDAVDLKKARAAGFYPPDYVFSPCPLDRPLADGETFKIGTLQVTVRVLPGHSSLDTYYFVRNESGHVSLFSGDGFFFDGKISMLNTHDFNLKGLARAAVELGRERVDSLFPGHLQPALRNGSRHLEKARRTFENLMVPPNIL